MKPLRKLLSHSCCQGNLPPLVPIRHPEVDLFRLLIDPANALLRVYRTESCSPFSRGQTSVGLLWKTEGARH